MNQRIASLSLVALCLTLAATSAMSQQTLYENGPVNGTTDAWSFSGGFRNTQSFSADGMMTTGFNGWFWIAPGDQLTGVQLSIGTFAFGSDVFNTTLGSPTTSNCFSNQYGYNVCDESWTFSGPAVHGNYWLTLQNGTTAFGTQPFWDENSGIGCQSTGCPSRAVLGMGGANFGGTIPSEAFTISGFSPQTCGANCRDNPEPTTFMLLGSGILGVASKLRRKLF